MAVNIYDELAALSTRLTAAEARLTKLETPPAPPPVLHRPMAVTYFRDAALWATTLAAKPPFVTINPFSGPGPSADSLYVAQIPRNTAAGVPTFAYTHTRYAARSVDEVMGDVAKYRAQYAGLSGFFVDTTSVRPEHVAYYEDLTARIHALGFKVCLNPGTNCPERYLQIADYVMSAETDSMAYETLYPGKVWHCVHTCGPTDMPRIVALAKARGAALITVTDDLMPNPYDKLPTYWSALCSQVAA
jgi:hypothetical protein